MAVPVRRAKAPTPSRLTLPDSRRPSSIKSPASTASNTSLASAASRTSTTSYTSAASRRSVPVRPQAAAPPPSTAAASKPAKRIQRAEPVFTKEAVPVRKSVVVRSRSTDWSSVRPCQVRDRTTWEALQLNDTECCAAIIEKCDRLARVVENADYVTQKHTQMAAALDLDDGVKRRQSVDYDDDDDEMFGTVSSVLASSTKVMSLSGRREQLILELGRMEEEEEVLLSRTMPNLAAYMDMPPSYTPSRSPPAKFAPSFNRTTGRTRSASVLEAATVTTTSRLRA